jgi:glycosyltransferase involved in cell wall biosynthesis
MDPEIININDPQIDIDEKIKVVVIGAIGKIKGYDVLLACANDALRRKLPIEFILMGYSMDDKLLKDANVHVTGRYNDKNSSKTLKTINPHYVWLPSLWPETYSYTFSIGIQNGYPVIAFNIGAISRRMKDLDTNYKEHLLPLNLAKSPDKINDRLVELRIRNLKKNSLFKVA